MVQIMVFGRNGCAKCESTKKKLGHFLAKWGMEKKVGMVFHDLDTVDGRAEGAFYDVGEVPATLVFDGERSIARWDGVVPDSREVRSHIEGGAQVTQN